MAKCGIPFAKPRDNDDVKDLILQALCMGLIENTAVASDPNKAKAGYQLVQGFKTNPTNVRIHPSSVFGKSDDGIEFIVYQDRTISRREDRYVVCVSKVTKKHLLDAKRNSVDQTTFRQFERQLKKMIRETYVIKFNDIKPKGVTKHELDAIINNLKDVQEEFPYAIVPGPKASGKKPTKKDSKVKDLTVSIKCSKGVVEALRVAVNWAISAALDYTEIIDVGKSILIFFGIIF